MSEGIGGGGGVGVKRYICPMDSQNLAWILALAAYGVVSTAFLVVMALVIKNFLRESPAALHRNVDEFRQEVSATVETMRTDWITALEAINEAAERASRERKKIQMREGREAKAAEQAQLELQNSQFPAETDINAARREARRQGLL